MESLQAQPVSWPMWDGSCPNTLDILDGLVPLIILSRDTRVSQLGCSQGEYYNYTPGLYDLGYKHNILGVKKTVILVGKKLIIVFLF